MTEWPLLLSIICLSTAVIALSRRMNRFERWIEEIEHHVDSTKEEKDQDD